MSEPETPGLRLLSFDGGGIRGLSSLLVLQTIMHRIKTEENQADIRPCDYFDLIGGTSTGGIIALMLGRLRMSVEEAITCYDNLAGKVFSKLKRSGDGKYSATLLEEVIKAIAKERAGGSEAQLLDDGALGGICKTFVCAMNAYNMNARKPVLFRTYESPKEPSIPCTIWQAARATSAAPTFFKRVFIGPATRAEPYIDGGIGRNNPTAQVLEEAEAIFPDKKIACVISIGTGKPGTIDVPNPGFLERNVIPVGVIKAMVAMATDCEETAQQMEKRFEHWPKTYFRFNVEQGLQKVKLGDWDRMGEVSAHTRNYMSMHEVDQRLTTVVAVIRERKGGIQTSATNAIPNQSSIIPVRVDINTSKMRKALEQLRPSKKADYKTVLEEQGLKREECTPDTRVKILRDITEWANDHSLDSPRVFWLTGQAGSGKTTIAYTIAKHFGKDGNADEDAILGGNFFCSRQFQETQYQTRILPTIAYQLGRKCKSYADTLYAADKFDAVDHNVATQLQDLLIGPWRKSNLALSPDVHPYLIIIDALDEIKDSVGLSLESGGLSFLRGLLNAINEYDLTGFKFLVTSRPDPDIASLCESFTSKTICRLQDVPIEEAKADVETYLNMKLPTLTGSPELANVGQEAGGLFIYAATVVRYLTPHRSITTKERTRMLNDLLSKSSSAGNATSLIDSLYRQIMLDAFSKFTGDSLTSRLRILYTYLCTAERTSASTVAELVADGDDEAAKAVLDTLHAVLYVQGDQVFWYHASFPDFIFDEARSNFGQNEKSISRYSCNAPAHHSLLGQSCFCVMESGLRFNIANIKSSFILDRDNPELPGAVKRNISTVLSYSCRNWDYHVTAGASTDSNDIRNILSEFLQLRVLFWIEVMNLLDLRGHCERMLRAVHKWVKKDDPVLGQAFAEATSFALYFSGSDASLSTPHLYISSLATWARNDGITQGWRSHFHGIPIFTNALSTGVTLMTLKMTEPVEAVAISSDGVCIVSGSRDKSVRIWDASTGEIQKALVGHTSYVASVAFSSDGMHVVSGSGDTSVRIWDASTGAMQKVLEGHTSAITSVAFSRDGEYIVSGSHDKSARIWNASTGEMLKALEGHTSSVASVAFSCDGRYIVSSSGDKSVRIWDASTGEVRKVLEGHTEYITSAAFSSDDTRIVSGSFDDSVRIWDASTGKMQMVLEGHTSYVTSVAFSKDGMSIVSGSNDKSVRIWNASTGEMQMVLAGHTLVVASVAFSSDGRYIVSGSGDKSVRIWDASTVEIQTVLRDSEGHTSYVTSVAFSSDGRYIVSGSGDESVRIWDASTGEMLKLLEGHTMPVKSVAFSSDSMHIVSGSRDKSVRIWDTSTGEVQKVLEGHTRPVESVAFLNNSMCIVSGSRDRSVRIWDVSTGKMHKVLEGHTRPVESTAFSSDGMRIVSGSADHSVRIWDASTGKMQKVLRHSMPVQSVAFSNDGTRIVSGSRDGSVWIWDASTGEMQKALEGHSSYVTSVAFSSDGMRIASGSGDKSIRIWDALTGKMQKILEGHSMPVKSVAFSNDGMYVVSGSEEKMVRVWALTVHQASRSSYIRQKTEDDSSGQYEHTGWLISPKTQHYLMFVPLSANLPDPSNILTLPTSHAPSVDFTSSTLGPEWHKCFSPHAAVLTI